MTNMMKAIFAIFAMMVLYICLDYAIDVDENQTCSTSSAEWCGMMYQDRLADAHQELTSCQLQYPQKEHANHDDGCMYCSHCDESRDSFTKWVVPANSYLLRRCRLSEEDYKLQVLLAEHIGGTPEHWPLSVEIVTEMGY